MTTLTRLLNIFLAALLTGIIVTVWIVDNPQNLPAEQYIVIQQNMVRSLNDLMPVLGAITILSTLVSAALQRKKKDVFITLLIAAFLFIVTGLITRLGNQPINAVVMTWKSNSIPANWTGLKDKWWLFHEIRTVSSTIALLLVLWASIRKGSGAGN